jgi:hypothetical protein
MNVNKLPLKAPIKSNLKIDDMGQNGKKPGLKWKLSFTTAHVKGIICRNMVLV